MVGEAENQEKPVYQRGEEHFTEGVVNYLVELKLLLS